MNTKIREIKLAGIPASPGIAIGTALILSPRTFDIEKRIIQKEEAEQEILVFEKALDKSKEQISIIQRQVQATLKDGEAKIFQSHLLLLDDYMLINSVKEEIKNNLVSADYSFNLKIQFYIDTIDK